MRQGDDVGAVDAHELVCGQLSDQILQTIQHDNGLVCICQMEFDVFAHALDINDLASVYTDDASVCLEVKDKVFFPG